MPFGFGKRRQAVTDNDDEYDAEQNDYNAPPAHAFNQGSNNNNNHDEEYDLPAEGSFAGVTADGQQQNFPDSKSGLTAAERLSMISVADNTKDHERSLRQKKRQNCCTRCYLLAILAAIGLAIGLFFVFGGDNAAIARDTFVDSWRPPAPSPRPTRMPTIRPSGMPSVTASSEPSLLPTAKATDIPSISPTLRASGMPSLNPSLTSSAPTSAAPTLASEPTTSTAPTATEESVTDATNTTDITPGSEGDNIMMTNDTLSPDCSTLFTCEDCLNEEGCQGWSMSGCYPTCNDAPMDDVTCWSSEYQGPEICSSDSAICGGMTDCTSCVEYMLSDGENTCQWFPNADDSGGYCAFECGMNGCGVRTCATKGDTTVNEGDTTSTPGSGGEELFCPQDIRNCTDGSTVLRNSTNNCSFYECPDGSSMIEPVVEDDNATHQIDDHGDKYTKSLVQGDNIFALLPSSKPTEFPTYLTCPDGTELSTLYMYDAIGDGWDDAQISIMEVSDDGNTKADSPLFKGGLTGFESEGTRQLCIKSDACYSVVVDGGMWMNEIKWGIGSTAFNAPALLFRAADSIEMKATWFPPADCKFSLNGACENVCKKGYGENEAPLDSDGNEIVKDKQVVQEDSSQGGGSELVREVEPTPPQEQQITPTESPPTAAPPTAPPPTTVAVVPTVEPPTAAPPTAPPPTTVAVVPTVAPPTGAAPTAPPPTPAAVVPTAAQPVAATPKPTMMPVSSSPTLSPVTASPTKIPTPEPTMMPVSSSPTLSPVTASPTKIPTPEPTMMPVSSSPTLSPVTASPTKIPTPEPTMMPVSSSPTLSPVTASPTKIPTPEPTPLPGNPSKAPVPPTPRPTKFPTSMSSKRPTQYPSPAPTPWPSRSPVSSRPTRSPVSNSPTRSPTIDASQPAIPGTTYSATTNNDDEVSISWSYYSASYSYVSYERRERREKERGRRRAKRLGGRGRG